MQNFDEEVEKVTYLMLVPCKIEGIPHGISTPNKRFSQYDEYTTSNLHEIKMLDSMPVNMVIRKPSAQISSEAQEEAKEEEETKEEEEAKEEKPLDKAKLKNLTVATLRLLYDPDNCIYSRKMRKAAFIDAIVEAQKRP